MKTFKARVVFTEGMLGTSPSDEKVFSTYIASNAPDAATMEEEIAEHGIEAVEEKGMTVFPRDPDGQVCVYDYMWKGFFKESIKFLRQIPKTKASTIKAYKTKVDGLVFVNPRHIQLHIPEGQTMGNCQRSLRAQTAQGDRVALANSEEVPAGTWCEFEVECLTDDLYPVMLECMEYGKRHGFGQWRNSGKGRFEFEHLGMVDELTDE